MSTPSAAAQPFFSNFPQAFATLVSETLCLDIFARHGPRGGGKPKLSPWQWLMARVYHAFAMTGSFSTQLTGLLATNTYYYRCWVSNEVGSVWAVSGTNFTTDRLRGPVFRAR